MNLMQADHPRHHSGLTEFIPISSSGHSDNCREARWGSMPPMSPQQITAFVAAHAASGTLVAVDRLLSAAISSSITLGFINGTSGWLAGSSRSYCAQRGADGMAHHRWHPADRGGRHPREAA
jgi:hypothetical protein